MDAPFSPPSTSQSAAITTTPLRALRTDTKLSPRSQTQATRVLAALTRIASVSIRDVLKEDGHRFFVIDVRFCKTLQGLPTASTTSTDSTTLSPPSKASDPGDVQLKRRFLEFSNLRHEMYYHAHAGHRQRQPLCTFCATVVDVLTHAPTLPRFHKLLLHSTDTVRQQLEDFLSLVVQLATQAKNDASASGHWCEGRAMVPLLVKQFLLGNDGESDASVRSGTNSGPRPEGWAYVNAWSA